MHPFHKCWFHSTLIFCCATCNLPLLEIGYFLTVNYGASAALLFIFFGNALLVGLALLSFAMARENRTQSLCYFSLWFNKSWQKVIILISTAWLFFLAAFFFHKLYQIIVHLGVQSEPLSNKNILLYILVASTIGLLASRPAHLIFRIALACLCFFSLLALGLYFFASSAPVHPFPYGLGYGGISTVIAAALPTLFFFPNYWHSTGTIGGIMGCLVLFYGLALPLVECGGVALALVSSQATAYQALISFDGGGHYFAILLNVGCLISAAFLALFCLFLIRINGLLFPARFSASFATHLTAIAAAALSFLVNTTLFSHLLFFFSIFIASALAVLLTSQQLRLWRIVPSSQKAAQRYRAAALISFSLALLHYYFEWSLTENIMIDAFFYGVIFTLLGHCCLNNSRYAKFD